MSLLQSELDRINEFFRKHGDEHGKYYVPLLTAEISHERKKREEAEADYRVEHKAANLKESELRGEIERLKAKLADWEKRWGEGIAASLWRGETGMSAILVFVKIVRNGHSDVVKFDHELFDLQPGEKCRVRLVRYPEPEEVKGGE